LVGLAGSFVAFPHDPWVETAWKNGSHVGPLAGKPVRLRFDIHDADVYSYQFAKCMKSLTFPFYRVSQKPLADWSSVGKLHLRPKPGSDLTKVLFADFEWAMRQARMENRRLPQEANSEPFIRIEDEIDESTGCSTGNYTDFPTGSS
jgi:hypothetical protein